MNIVLTSTAHASREMKHHHHDSHEQDIFLVAIFRENAWIRSVPSSRSFGEGHRDKMGVSTQMTLSIHKILYIEYETLGSFGGVPQFWEHTHPYLQKIYQNHPIFWRKLHVPISSACCST